MRAETAPVKRHCPTDSPHACWWGGQPHQGPLVAGSTSFAPVFWKLFQIQDDDPLPPMKQHDQSPHHPRRRAARRLFSILLGRWRSGTQWKAGCQELFLPEAMVQGKLRKIRLGGKRKKPSTPQKANGWKTGEEEGWPAGRPAECSEGAALGHPRPAAASAGLLWGRLSSCAAGAGVEADKHRQNLKNCCLSPTDVHYVSGALRFAA